MTLQDLGNNIKYILETMKEGARTVAGLNTKPVVTYGKGPGFTIEETGHGMPVIDKTQEIPSYGNGQVSAKVHSVLYDELAKIQDPEIRAILTELSGQESSYGYAGPHISDKEESYGPFHLNVRAGRISPRTGKVFTKEEALNVPYMVEYAKNEYNRTGGLGAWNPGAYDFYQYDIPERAKTKKYIRGL